MNINSNPDHFPGWLSNISERYFMNRNHGKMRIMRHFGSGLMIMSALIFPELTISQQVLPKSQLNTDTIEYISWQRKFDENDRLTKLTDPAGRETTFAYSEDSSGNTIVSKINNEDDVIKFEFNDHDLLNFMKDGSGTVTYQYDGFGRLIRMQREGEASVSYEYNIEDRITRQAIGDFYLVSYSYDFLGRLSSINTPAGKISYEYQTGIGQVIRLLPNGVKTIWEFGVNGQQLKVTHVDQNNFLLAEFRYQYRPDGLIEAISESSQQTENIIYYEYDNVGRLIRVTDVSGSEYLYEYDQVGNRVMASSPGGAKQLCEYDWAGRLVKLDGKECNYDAAGNLTSVILGEAEMKYQFNQDCQLNNVNHKVFYKYDGNGELIERQSDGEMTKFIPDPLSDFWQPLVMENQADGRTLLVWDRNTPLVIIRNGTPEYLLHDHLGSTRLIVDQQGKVKQYIDYDPFGAMKNPENKKDFFPRFSGLFWDSDARLYFTLARAFCPTLGSFLGIDLQLNPPSGLNRSLSIYVYCDGDPINNVDRDGFHPEHFLATTYNSVNANTWWNAYWNDVSTHLFDSRRAKDMYGSYSEAHLSNARGAGIAASLTASFYDIVGGYIPGEGGNNGQKYASIAWSLLPMAGSGLAGKSFSAAKDIWTGFSVGRNFAAAEINLKQDHPVKAAINIVGASSGLFKYATKSIISQLSDQGRPTELVIESMKNSAETYGNYSKLLSITSSVYNASTLSDLTQKSHKEKAYTTLPNQISPSNVGGVYLGGAAKALDGIGEIEGLSLDANNNLILISKKGTQINMPPLRIDDIVTVFRSVYINGEGPTVTIDPNPEDPANSAMIIRHGKATEDTYVGWVLYQADRLMKCYMLGIDNISTQDLISKVPGYDEVLDAINFGNGITNTSKREGKWERFWIVPAGVNQFNSKSDSLTLFDVPLKVKTQLMKWENGELVNDSTGESSLGARKFTEWFTWEYDAIAREQYLMPPPEFDIKEPVPVFTELQRIALLTAIAEKMRDQGIPMPFWMRDYEIRQVQFEKYTPGLQVTRTKGNTTAQIFGGVSLSSDSKEVRQFTSVAELEKLTGEERLIGEKNLEVANTLSSAIREFDAQSASLQYRTFEIENESYQTVQLPGLSTKALSPCRLEEADLIIPVAGGKDIRLSRLFNSFFNPKDIWGQAWTMDLPRLEKVRVPLESNGDLITYQDGYELLTPLNSNYVKFSEVKEVTALDARLQVPDVECDFFGLANSNPNFLNNPTIELIGKNGESWHFTEEGNLIAIEKDGFRIVYLRDLNGNVSQIVGLLGKNIMATIDLKYNDVSRLMSAKGENSSGEVRTVTYDYDASGRLTKVASAEGETGYEYENYRVSEETWHVTNSTSVDQESKKIILRRFEYNEQGQLIAELNEDEKRVDYRVTMDEGKTTLKINQAEDPAKTIATSFDPTFRPLETLYYDGTRVKWTYPENGGSSVEYIDASGTKTCITESADRTKRTIEIAEQPTLTEFYDPVGRLSRLNLNSQNLFQQQWSPNGKLQSIETENCVFRPLYDEDGLTKRITLFPPGSGDQLNEWGDMELDITGKPTQITDYTGLTMNIQYDNKGEISQFITERDGKNYGYGILRNVKGQVETVESSWGNEYYKYDSTGTISEMIIKKPGIQNDQQAAVEFNSGRLHRIVQFDGGQIEISYCSEAGQSDLPSQIDCANGLKLNYGYDPSGYLNNVSIGNDRRINLGYDNKGRIESYSINNGPH